MFLLDTDHVVIVQQQSAPEYDRLLRRVRRRDPDDLFVSVVSFHEQVMGWNANISRAKDSAGVVRGYSRLLGVLANFAEANVLPFDDAAVAAFDDLRRRGVRIGTMDLRIAAIALARDMTVLSRNLVDFERVPGLQIEDWTAP